MSRLDCQGALDGAQTGGSTRSRSETPKKTQGTNHQMTRTLSGSTIESLGSSQSAIIPRTFMKGARISIVDCNGLPMAHAFIVDDEPPIPEDIPNFEGKEDLPVGT